MTLDQVQLPKNINIGGRQRSLLEAEEFDMNADLEQRLIAVTHKRSGRRTIITFEGVAMTPAVAEKRVRKAG